MAKRWTTLKRQIDDLRRLLLPDQFDPLGVYAEAARVQLQTRAFLVLSHAEIESYLEDWAKDIVRASEQLWLSSKRVGTPLAFLLSTIGGRFAPVESLSQNKGDSHQRFGDVITSLFPIYYKRIKDNHGIKEKNVLHLFEPIGVPSTAFSSTLLPNLDSLGSKRGDHAHQSKAVASVLDPEVEYKGMVNVLSDLQTLEQWLVEYRRKIR